MDILYTTTIDLTSQAHGHQNKARAPTSSDFSIGTDSKKDWYTCL